MQTQATSINNLPKNMPPTEKSNENSNLVDDILNELNNVGKPSLNPAIRQNTINNRQAPNINNFQNTSSMNNQNLNQGTNQNMNQNMSQNLNQKLNQGMNQNMNQGIDPNTISTQLQSHHGINNLNNPNINNFQNSKISAYNVPNNTITHMSNKLQNKNNSKFSLKTINRYIKSINKSTLINSFVIFVIITVLGIPIIHNIFCLLPYVYDMYGKTTVYLGMYKGIFASIIFMILSYIINKF